MSKRKEANVGKVNPKTKDYSAILDKIEASIKTGKLEASKDILDLPDGQGIDATLATVSRYGTREDRNRAYELSLESAALKGEAKEERISALDRFEKKRHFAANFGMSKYGFNEIN